MKRAFQLCLRGPPPTRPPVSSLLNAMLRSKYKRRYHSAADVVENRGNAQMPDPATIGHRPRQAAGPKSQTNGDPSRLSTNDPNHYTSRQAPQTAQPFTMDTSSQRVASRKGAPSHTGARKRKADDASFSAGPPNKRRAGGEGIMDEARIRLEMPLPKRGGYSRNAPKQLFDLNPIRALNDGLQALHLTYTKETRAQGGITACTLTAQGEDGFQEVAEAEGKSKPDAIRAAHLMMLSKMHTSGFLRTVIEGTNATDLDDIDKQTLENEADAKSEVYNYSARYGLIPQFNAGQSARRMVGKGQNAVDVTINLPQQNISVSARRLDVRTAEIAAAVKFKEAAERYHAERKSEPTLGEEQIMLHTGNAKLFFDYLKAFKPDLKVEFKASSLGGRPGKRRGKSKRSGMSSNPVWQAQMMREQMVKPDASTKKSFLDMLEPTQPAKEFVPITEPVTMANKRDVEVVAQLAAAVTMCNEDPALLKGFRNSMSSTGTTILNPIRPVFLQIDEDAELIMEDTLRDARRAGLADEREQLIADEQQRDDRRPRHIRQALNEDQILAKSERLSSQQKLFEEDPNLKELREKKASLPMSQYRERVLELVEGHLYSVIVGATGSGKTTQVPQIVLEDAISKGQGAHCNVICTQPRRIAATSVARRVADERNERLQNSVGYHVRFDPKRPQQGGSITYCTTGILLQQLQNSPDEIFDTTSHIIIDEVHERDILIDFLMIMLKNAIKSRSAAGKSVPKVVLMSATIDSELFANYFEHQSADGKTVACPSLSVPGRTYPVKEKYLDGILKELQDGTPDMNPRGAWMMSDPGTKDYLEVERTFRPTNTTAQEQDEDDDGEATIDWKLERRLGSGGQTLNEKEDGLIPVNLVAATIAQICKNNDEGAVLVFLPGFDEMKKVAETLRGQRSGKSRAANFGVDFNDAEKHKLIMLHSSIPANEQAEAFEPVPPGCRKIILSTNIAETSVTIPDIQFVVDTGKLREKRYDQIRRITQLQCTWISKSNAKQRAGRAGRVQNGNYYALYSKPRFESLRAIGLPEILRSDLQEICLDIKAQAFQSPIREFLSQSIEPPAPAAVDASVQNLQGLQALTEEEDLTALGRLLAQLPVHPSLGKMIVLGVIFRCLDPMIILGATLSERSLFVAPPDKRREAHELQQQFGEGTGSDHYALLNAFTQLRLIRETKGQWAMMDFAHKNFLHAGAFKTIDATTKQIEEVLVDAGLIPRVAENERFESERGPPALNTNATNVAVIKALALAGLHPNLAVATSSKLLRTPGEKNAMLHPSSLSYVRESDMRQKIRARDTAEARGIMPAPGSDDMIGLPPNSLVSYSTMAKSNDGKSIFLRDVSTSSPLMAVLFGGRLRKTGNTLEMDNWLPFEVRAGRRTVGVLVEFRKAMDRMLTRAFRDLSGAKGKGEAVVAGTGDASASRGAVGVNGTSVGRAKKSEGFADDEVRRLFAEGLVDVLNRDLERKQRRRAGGAGGGGRSGHGGGDRGVDSRFDKGFDRTGGRDRGFDRGRNNRKGIDDDDWIFGGKGGGFGKGRDGSDYAFGGRRR